MTAHVEVQQLSPAVVAQRANAISRLDDWQTVVTLTDLRSAWSAKGKSCPLVEITRGQLMDEFRTLTNIREDDLCLNIFAIIGEEVQTKALGMRNTPELLAQVSAWLFSLADNTTVITFRVVEYGGVELDENLSEEDWTLAELERDSRELRGYKLH